MGVLYVLFSIRVTQWLAAFANLLMSRFELAVAGRWGMLEDWSESGNEIVQ